jgi:predicted NAD-dependent protein-ADP-ribosyltransferase YbiA (DUF1768 family)
MPEQVDENTPFSIKDYLKIEPPYPEERMKRIKFFYKKREKNPKRYTYTENGDLEFRGKSGAVEETIHLKVYMPHDEITREMRDQNRLDAIAKAEEDYDAAGQRLREALEAYKVSGATQPVLAAQKEVAAADQILARVLYGSRAIESMRNPKLGEIDFDAKDKNKRLIGQGEDPYKKEVARLITLEFPYQDFYGAYVDAAPDADVPDDIDGDADADNLDGLARKKLKDGRMARIFFDVGDGANGFLSPFWPVNYTLENTAYYTALQAYEVARAKEYSQEEIRKALLGTRSTRTMRFLTKNFEKPIKDSKGTWLKIFGAIYQQHPELKAKLLATGTDALVFADTRAGPSGIGLSENDRNVIDSSKWLGENHVGLALENLRYQFREGTAAEVARNDAPTERVISTEEQEKAKQGAIINTARKFQFKRKGAAV